MTILTERVRGEEEGKAFQRDDQKETEEEKEECRKKIIIRV